MAKELLKKFQCSFCGAPSESGVYAVCVRSDLLKTKNNENKPERILYIGSSLNMKKRIYSRNHPFSFIYSRLSNYNVYVRYLATENYISIEKELISKINPIFNQKHRTN